MALRCLDLPEIVGDICEELRCSYSFRSLAVFAVTDRLICEVALDALWREQRSLVPLLKILPQHRVDEISSRELRLVRSLLGLAAKIGLTSSLQVIKEPITPQGWARMQYYASRVIILDLHRHNGCIVLARRAGVHGLPTLPRRDPRRNPRHDAPVVRQSGPPVLVLDLKYVRTRSISPSPLTPCTQSTRSSRS